MDKTDIEKSKVTCIDGIYIVVKSCDECPFHQTDYQDEEVMEYHDCNYPGAEVILPDDELWSEGNHGPWKRKVWFPSNCPLRIKED